MRHKQLIINLIASITTFVVTMGINFFLTPYIVERMGREAYGFIGLINNIISYAAIVTVALNSMASRFITLKIHQENEKEANIYFNSVLIGNIIMAIVISIVCLILLVNLGKILNIPSNLNSDVKLAFLLTSIEFILNLICSIFGIATFVTNKLYLSSMRTIEANIIKAVVIMLLFISFKPRIFYINIAAITMSIYVILKNIYYTKKLLPQIKISVSNFRYSAVLELIKSGIWNIFSRLSQILETGLDLLLANVFLGSTFMGILSISKTIPNSFISLTGTIVGVFSPQLTISYAKNNLRELLEGFKVSVKIMSIITSLFFAFIIVYSGQFYKLWVPTEDSKLLYILTVLAVFHMPITSGMNSIYNIFTITNKIRKVSIVLFCNSAVNALIIILSAKFLPSKYSIFIIAGTSSLLALLIIVFFCIPYAARCLGLKWFELFPNVLICISTNSITVIVFMLVKSLINVNSWFDMITSLGISGVLGLGVNIMIVMNRQERKKFFNRIKGRE